MKILNPILLIVFFVVHQALHAQNIFPSTGRVGIGTTNPVSLLDIHGPIHFQTTTLMYNDGPQADGFKLRWTNRFNGQLGRDFLLFEKTDANGSYPDGGIAFLNTGRDSVPSYSFLLDGRGNAGFGTISPRYHVHIDDSLNNNMLLSRRQSAGLHFRVDTNNDAFISNKNNFVGNSTTKNRFLQFVGEQGLYFRTGNPNNSAGDVRMMIRSNGRVGIGTSTPADKLDVNGIIATGSTGTADGVLRLYTTRPDPTQSTWSGTAGSGNEAWHLISRNMASPYTNQGDLMFSYFDDERWRTHMVLDHETGALAIGTNPRPNGYKLMVDGKVLCEELKVQLSQNWPDYVFSSDYELMPLSEVEQHIDAKGHLPGVPSAATVEEEGGVAVGEMQRKLLEKVEELTLYLIDLEKKNKELTQRLETLENK